MKKTYIITANQSRTTNHSGATIEGYTIEARNTIGAIIRFCIRFHHFGMKPGHIISVTLEG